MKEPKLILCSDWQKLIREINRQLKPRHLKVKYTSNYKKWGDQIKVQVKHLPQSYTDFL